MAGLFAQIKDLKSLYGYKKVILMNEIKWLALFSGPRARYWRRKSISETRDEEPNFRCFLHWIRKLSCENEKGKNPQENLHWKMYFDQQFIPFLFFVLLLRIDIKIKLIQAVYTYTSLSKSLRKYSSKLNNFERKIRNLSAILADDGVSFRLFCALYSHKARCLNQWKYALYWNLMALR